MLTGLDLAIIIERCARGTKVDKPVLDLAKQLGGYWEYGQRQGDVQGLVQVEIPPPVTKARLGHRPLWLFRKGLLNSTGRPIRGRANDPALGNLYAVEQLFKRISER